MHRHSLASFIAAMVAAGVCAAQVSRPSPLNPPTNGPRRTAPAEQVLIADHVHVRPGDEPIDAAVVIEDGRIQQVIANPGDRDWGTARVYDLGESHLFAGFIDAHREVDVTKPEADSPGAHWSDLVTPQRRAADGTLLSGSDKSKLRELGFTAAAIAPKGGIFAGRAAVVSLAPDEEERSDRTSMVYRADAYHTLGLQSAGWGSRAYPTSQMGSISLIRQTLSDAAYYAKNKNEADEAGCINDLNELGDLPLVFRTDDELEVLRAAKIADEFSRPLLVVGTGTEFRRLDAIAALKNRDGFGLIVPLTIPDKPDVSTVGRAEDTDLRTLMTWEQAPTNIRRLHDAGVKVALTSGGLRSGESFSKNLTHAMQLGLEGRAALAMLTTTPAAMLGVQDELGTIERGKRASLVVASGNLFDARARSAKKDAPRVLDVWVDGQRCVVSVPDAPRFDGEWTLAVGDFFEMTAEFKGDQITFTETNEDESTTTSKARDVNLGPDGTISFLYDNPENQGERGAYIMTGVLGSAGTISGSGIHPSGRTFAWTATPVEGEDGQDDAAGDAGESAADSLPGDWNGELGDGTRFGVKIKKDKDDWSAVVTETMPDGTVVKQDNTAVTFADGTLTIAFDHAPFGDAGLFTLNARADGDDSITGTGTSHTGNAIQWTASRAFDVYVPPAELPGYPFGAFASKELPPQERVLFRSATLWTMTDQGVIEEGDLLIENGKIAYVGPSKDWVFKAGEEPKIVTMVGRRGPGRHITPGLIDAHSHTGISRGVNEAGQAVTSEVRIQDVTDPDSMNWYRQLAGGVTAVNSMHGSANPIGGQTQTNKVRWGVSDPDAMHFEDAKPGIKFALGENVKQSNWGDEYTTRYPQTRMGVETIIRDRFNAAREYARDNSARTDFELEALKEILEGDRWIHCHSYRQDEILMLCKIAAEYGFKIGTFQHGLEVYKVAEHVKENAVGASLFSDWWAYKVEVQDAIAYAGPLQAEVGVLTSYNSDSDELARRMAAEAAKAYKYADGSLTKEQALAFVTINPAIQLGIDSRVGTLEVGKDADLALWSRDPLDTFARCTATYIDGREYFSRNRDRELREANAAHRTRIIQHLLGEPKDKPKTTPAETPEGELAFNTGPEADALRDQTLDMIRLGKDPANHECGDCGATHIHLSDAHEGHH